MMISEERDNDCDLNCQKELLTLQLQRTIFERTKVWLLKNHGGNGNIWHFLLPLFLTYPHELVRCAYNWTPPTSHQKYTNITRRIDPYFKVIDANDLGQA